MNALNQDAFTSAKPSQVDQINAIITAAKACLYPASTGKLWAHHYALKSLLNAFHDLTGLDEVYELMAGMDREDDPRDKRRPNVVDRTEHGAGGAL